MFSPNLKVLTVLKNNTSHHKRSKYVKLWKLLSKFPREHEMNDLLHSLHDTNETLAARKTSFGKASFIKKNEWVSELKIAILQSQFNVPSNRKIQLFHTYLYFFHSTSLLVLEQNTWHHKTDFALFMRISLTAIRIFCFLFRTF